MKIDASSGSNITGDFKFQILQQFQYPQDQM
jgi:hypothetical protein